MKELMVLCFTKMLCSLDTLCLLWLCVCVHLCMNVVSSWVSFVVTFAWKCSTYRTIFNSLSSHCAHCRPWPSSTIHCCSTTSEVRCTMYYHVACTSCLKLPISLFPLPYLSSLSPLFPHPVFSSNSSPSLEVIILLPCFHFCSYSHFLPCYQFHPFMSTIWRPLPTSNLYFQQYTPLPSSIPIPSLPIPPLPFHPSFPPYHTIPYHTIPYHTVPYHTIPYRTIPYHTISYHTILYHTIPPSPSFPCTLTPTPFQCLTKGP